MPLHFARIPSLLLAFSLAACAVAPPKNAPAAGNLPTPIPGISGMAPLGNGYYLIVVDTKSFSDAPRFGLLDPVVKGGSRFTALQVRNWDEVGGKSNDLEAVCALKDRMGEFLAIESSYRDAEYGRVMHVRVHGGQVEIARAMPLPKERSNGKDGIGYEGLACRRIGPDRYLLALGERGGSRLRPRGTLRFGEFDAASGTLRWQSDETPLLAPGNWLTDPPHRDLADLYVDDAGVLWAVAASDPDEYGPFRSLVWSPGRMGNSLASPYFPAPDREPRWVVDGFKVEAVSAPDPRISGSVLSIGSEDEKLGGVWRALGPSNARD